MIQVEIENHMLIDELHEKESKYKEDDYDYLACMLDDERKAEMEEDG